jgi:arylformamidase
VKESLRRHNLKVIDITLKLDEHIAVYKGDPRFSAEIFRSIEDDGFELSKLRMGTHSGTHIDAPCHFIKGGKNISEIPLRVFIGECVVVDDIDSFAGGAERVLIKGGKKISKEQAKKLTQQKVCLVGTENLSIGGDDVHKELLGQECVVLESLNLKKVKPGKYMLYAAPLKIETDGCPVRACLIEMK